MTTMASAGVAGAVTATAAHTDDGLPDAMLLDRLPANASEVGDAVKSAEQGMEVVLRGRIARSDDVFEAGRAQFWIADERAVPSDGEAEDGREQQDVPAAMRATVQFRDSNGTVLPIGLEDKHRLEPGREIFVTGTVVEADGRETLVVNATGLHVPQGDVPFGLFLDHAPDRVLNVIDAKQSVSQSETVVIRGRIGGSKQPFVDGRAIFTIVGQGPLACSDIPDDPCRMPWDYCCVPQEELRAHSATIQVAGDGRSPIRTDIKGRRGIRELADVTVVGEVMVNARGALVVKATGIYVNDPGVAH